MFLRYPELKRINTTIRLEDYNFAKKHNIKIAHAIRAFLRDYRANISDPNAEYSVKEMRKKIDNLVNFNRKVLNFLQEKDLLLQFSNSNKKNKHLNKKKSKN